MIDVCVNIDGNSFLLTMDGHATGNELVCAAASAIVYALSGYLVNAKEHLEEMKHNDLSSGHACISCMGDACIAAAFRMAGIGLAQLEKKYPELLSVIFWKNKKFFCFRGESTKKDR